MLFLPPPPANSYLGVPPPVLRARAAFGYGLFAEIPELNQAHEGGPNPM